MHGIENLQLLMNYTIFHIGLYTTLGATLVAFLGTGRAGGMQTQLLIALGCFVLAGICGALIASNIPFFPAPDLFKESTIGPWNLKLIPAWLCMSLEHMFFWIGIGAALFGLVRVILKRPTT